MGRSQADFYKPKLDLIPDSDLCVKAVYAKVRKPGGFLHRNLEYLKAKWQAGRIARSPLFDAEWYLQQNPDVSNNPLFAKKPALHYLLHGADEGRDPSPEFSNRRYLNNNPDVAYEGFNPLLHYITHGKNEGRTR